VAHPIVGRLEAVDRDRRVDQAGARQLRRERFGNAAATGGQRGGDAALAQRAHDVEETGVEVGLAADQCDLAGAHCGELVDDAERLERRELAIASDAGARATVRARVIASERQLPDDIRGRRLLGDDVQPPAIATVGHHSPHCLRRCCAPDVRRSCVITV
jgi:hypothetical protein